MSLSEWLKTPTRTWRSQVQVSPIALAEFPPPLNVSVGLSKTLLKSVKVMQITGLGTCLGAYNLLHVIPPHCKEHLWTN